MINLLKISSSIRKLSAYFILPLILTYLLINILDGNNGLQSHSILNTEILHLQKKIFDVKSENSLLNTKIALMHPNQQNEDLIDENLRRIYGYGKNNEYTIYFKKHTLD